MASFPEASHRTSGAGLTRRPVAATLSGAQAPVVGALRPDVDPPPRPKPILQTLAVVAIVALGGLQFFLQPTHFRDPADPRRSWIPFDPNRSAPISTYQRSPGEHLNMVSTQDEQLRGVHIFTLTECLDLRKLAVLANSTLSSSRYPEDIFFHFFVPEDEDEKLSYYKLKVVLPTSNLDFIGKKDIKEKLKVATSEEELIWAFRNEVAPIVIPAIHFSLSRYIYIAPDAIVKGNIEDFFSIDLGPYALGAVEDCSKRLGDYVSIEVLNAVQRTAAKSWISNKPYDQSACLPDFSVLLVNPHKLQRTLIDAVIWWTNVLNVKSEGGSHVRLAMALAFYDNYLKLPHAWKLDTFKGQAADDNETNVLRFDGPSRTCTHGEDQHQGSDEGGDIWKQYLSSKSITILNHL